MKKAFSVFVSVLVLLTIICVPSSADEPVTLKLTGTRVYAGEEFRLNVFISDNSQLSGAVIDVKYDSSMLEYISADNGVIISEDATVNIKNFEDKEYLRFTYMSPSSPIVSEGVLFTVMFKAKEGVKGDTNVELSIAYPGDFVNSDLEKLPYKVENSVVKILNNSIQEVETSETDSTSETQPSTSADTTSDTTTSTTTPQNQNSTENNSDKGSLAVIIGVICAGVVIISGVLIYTVINKKKRG